MATAPKRTPQPAKKVVAAQTSAPSLTAVAKLSHQVVAMVDDDMYAALVAYADTHRVSRGAAVREFLRHGRANAERWGEAQGKKPAVAPGRAARTRRAS